ncbi:hypothetical protein [Nostoc foliaceum]|uniref:hypothetical protein n=1 Tax=Nostoc foliaceum TaxID=2692914 RepID=UPI001A7EF172|nr:hypothetical protein [Nostoc foliaceum]
MAWAVSTARRNPNQKPAIPNERESFYLTEETLSRKNLTTNYENTSSRFSTPYSP